MRYARRGTPDAARPTRHARRGTPDAARPTRHAPRWHLGTLACGQWARWHVGSGDVGSGDVDTGDVDTGTPGPSRRSSAPNRAGCRTFGRSSASSFFEEASSSVRKPRSLKSKERRCGDAEPALCRIKGGSGAGHRAPPSQRLTAESKEGAVRDIAGRRANGSLPNQRRERCGHRGPPSQRLTAESKEGGGADIAGRRANGSLPSPAETEGRRGLRAASAHCRIKGAEVRGR
jgi:hypothetical protein